MRLIIVSNRLPYTVSIKQGKPQFGVSSGGLTTGLSSYVQRASIREPEPLDVLWLGWPGASIASEQQSAVCEYSAQKFKAWPVFLSQESVERFYLGFCNRTIWPLFHYRPSLTRY